MWLGCRNKVKSNTLKLELRKIKSTKRTKYADYKSITRIGALRLYHLHGKQATIRALCQGNPIQVSLSHYTTIRAAEEAEKRFAGYLKDLEKQGVLDES